MAKCAVCGTDAKKTDFIGVDKLREVCIPCKMAFQSLKDGKITKSAFLKPATDAELVSYINGQSFMTAEEKEKAINSIMMISGSRFDGFKIKQYLDFLSCDVILKNSPIAELGAKIENAITFSGELEVQSKVMANAKYNAIKKIKTIAVNRGANAIIGVEVSTVINGDVISVSISGTPVVVEEQ